jgi:hypothetical protein
MNSYMPRLVQASGKVYRLLLLFYPHSLRRRFGREMELLFQEQLRHEWEESGYMGFLRSWYCAGSELVRIALPARLLRLTLAFLLLLASPVLYGAPKAKGAGPSAAALSEDVVTFPSGKLTLHGMLFKPAGKGRSRQFCTTTAARPAC